MRPNSSRCASVSQPQRRLRDWSRVRSSEQQDAPTIPKFQSPVWKPATTFQRARRAAAISALTLAAITSRAAPSEVIIDFEQAPLAKPMPTWTEQEVVFALAGPLVNSKAAGRVMFFPYLPTARKGILNAMAAEQAIPLQAKFPRPVSQVTLVLWGSIGCPAKVQAFDAAGQVLDEASLPAVPARKSPGDPIPQFELTVRAPNIASIQLTGPRNGEYLAADELRFVPQP